MRRTWGGKVLCQLEFCSYSCVGIRVQRQGQAFGNLSSKSHVGRKGTNVERSAIPIWRVHVSTRSLRKTNFTNYKPWYKQKLAPLSLSLQLPQSPCRTISLDMEAESSRTASTRSRKKRKSEVNHDPPDPVHEDTKKPKPMRKRAAKLAGLLDLPLDILFEVCLSYP